MFLCLLHCIKLPGSCLFEHRFVWAFCEICREEQKQACVGKCGHSSNLAEIVFIHVIPGVLCCDGNGSRYEPRWGICLSVRNFVWSEQVFAQWHRSLWYEKGPIHLNMRSFLWDLQSGTKTCVKINDLCCHDIYSKSEPSWDIVFVWDLLACVAMGTFSGLSEHLCSHEGYHVCDHHFLVCYC